jgi:hypothetical protein
MITTPFETKMPLECGPSSLLPSAKDRTWMPAVRPNYPRSQEAASSCIFRQVELLFRTGPQNGKKETKRPASDVARRAAVKGVAIRYPIANRYRVTCGDKGGNADRALSLTGAATLIGGEIANRSGNTNRPPLPRETRSSTQLRPRGCGQLSYFTNGLKELESAELTVKPSYQSAPDQLRTKWVSEALPMRRGKFRETVHDATPGIRSWRSRKELRSKFHRDGQSHRYPPAINEPPQMEEDPDDRVSRNGAESEVRYALAVLLNTTASRKEPTQIRHASP